jgi:hypothetical protein
VVSAHVEPIRWALGDATHADGAITAKTRRGTELHRLVLENLRCFARTEVSLDAPVTVIIGQNGSGKTTIAEAIASLAPGPHEALDELPLRHGERDGAITLHGVGPRPLARWTLGSKGTTRHRLPLGRHDFVYGQYRDPTSHDASM